MPTVHANPYPWPYNGDWRPDNTALIIIDMQTDFCGEGGYVDAMGYDLSLTRAPIEPIKALLAAMRDEGLPRHPHARGPSARPRRSSRQQALALAPDRAPGSAIAGPCGKILVRGEPGWNIIDELAPLPGEPIIDKPGKGSFCATDLELILRSRGIEKSDADRHHHRRLRAHDDARGQRSRLRMPAGRPTAAARPIRGNHRAAIKMVTMQGGVFGAVAEFEGRDREPAVTRRAFVHRISANAPDDVSGLEAACATAQSTRNAVVAVFGKTEGNGLVNDFSRGFATRALQDALRAHREDADADEPCIVMSGGTEGALAPHFLVFEARELGRARCAGRAGDRARAHAAVAL